ncbi:RNF135 isoform 4 [Pongo abelii]|uniref:RNF135 isoform 4 n=1 Tax=Pongo abelii TaxID=9601 RepID=A0A2J8TN64_PONAB|nr:RNF135 isoform 4 [Pongo abelii]
MAGLGPSSAVPVWLAEDDLGCIICQGLLDWPATLPCGHSFCRHCLEGLWGARGVRRWACPTCRQGAAQQPQLRKNTLLQDLADKYRRAAREIQAGSDPAPCTCPGSSPRSSPAPRPRRRPELQRENSWKPRLPPHAHCLTRATLHSGELLGLLSGPSIQPLT